MKKRVSTSETHLSSLSPMVVGLFGHCIDRSWAGSDASVDMVSTLQLLPWSAAYISVYCNSIAGSHAFLLAVPILQVVSGRTPSLRQRCPMLETTMLAAALASRTGAPEQERQKQEDRQKLIESGYHPYSVACITAMRASFTW
jgi:hypothetical protein